MSTLSEIEYIIKVRLVLAKFNALLYKYDSITKNHIIKHIKDWIELYKKNIMKIILTFIIIYLKWILIITYILSIYVIIFKYQNVVIL